jgi:hypothetical protein
VFFQYLVMHAKLDHLYSKHEAIRPTSNTSSRRDMPQPTFALKKSPVCHACYAAGLQSNCPPGSSC